MNYKYIEKLVKDSKDGNENAKEKLVNEFTPYILNLCSRTFIHGYEFEDVKSECYRILFKCVSLYNPESHRFVAYATNGIKNSIFDLIKRYNSRRIFEGSEALILSDQLEDVLVSDCMSAEDIVCQSADYDEIRAAIKSLSDHHQEMINYLFFNGESYSKENTLKNYADMKSIKYPCALKRKNAALKKLATLLK